MKQVILAHSLHFLRPLMPEAKLPSIANLSKEELNAEIEKGYTDFIQGNVRPASEVFADIRKNYGI